MFCELGLIVFVISVIGFLSISYYSARRENKRFKADYQTLCLEFHSLQLENQRHGFASMLGFGKWLEGVACEAIGKNPLHKECLNKLFIQTDFDDDSFELQCFIHEAARSPELVMGVVIYWKCPERMFLIKIPGQANNWRNDQQTCAVIAVIKDTLENHKVPAFCKAQSA